MDTDRRIVPEGHISYLLEEDTISERTIEVKKLLHDSPDKIHRVAHTWMGHSGLNPMARIIIHHIPEVPKKIHTRQHKETPTAHHESIHHEDAHATVQHGHENAHETHGHGDHNPHTAGHHEDASHGHQHKHEVGDHHGHHGSEHHGGTFSSFVSTGHWFGDQGAYIFGMFGRIVGEIIGYFFKSLAVAIIFGPTRTILLIALIGTLFNNTMNTGLPVGITAGIAGIIHLIFTGINKMSGGHGESHVGGGHAHDGGHGGGHEHH